MLYCENKAETKQRECAAAAGGDAAECQRETIAEFSVSHRPRTNVWCGGGWGGVGAGGDAARRRQRTSLVFTRTFDSVTFKE